MLRSVSIALPLSLADRFAAIINALRAVFAEQKPVGPTLLDHIDWKLREVLERFLFLVAQIEAGTLRLYRPRLAMSRAAASGSVEKSCVGRIRSRPALAGSCGRCGAIASLLRSRPMLCARCWPSRTCRR